MFKPKVTIVTKSDATAQVAAGMNLLGSQEVLVGVPASAAPRDSSQAKGSPITNAALAYIHNYGSPAMNIPARPFMEPGIESAKREISEGFQKAGVAALEGKADQMMKSLHALGIKVVSAIRNKINSDIPPPLGRATLAARRRRGRTGTKTLVDTGQLRNSITYVVRKSK
jgi:phage gpG-like protein